MKSKISKRFKKLLESSKDKKTEKIEYAIEKVKSNCTTKFNESIDLSLNLNLKQKKEEVTLRTTVNLPHGNGKKIRVAVLCEDSKISEAKDSGADLLGADKLMSDITAGKIAWVMTVKYEIPSISDITNAAAPIIGGIICPLTEAATSTAPALTAESPVLFIIGIVKVPVVTVLATEDPEINPVRPDARMAAFAGPPLILPTKANAKLKKYFPPPAVSRIAPNNTNKKIKLTETLIGIPKIASPVNQWYPTNLLIDKPWWAIKSGIDCPKIEKIKKIIAMIANGIPMARLVASNNKIIPRAPIIIS